MTRLLSALLVLVLSLVLSVHPASAIGRIGSLKKAKSHTDAALQPSLEAIAHTNVASSLASLPIPAALLLTLDSSVTVEAESASEAAEIGSTTALPTPTFPIRRLGTMRQQLRGGVTDDAVLASVSRLGYYFDIDFLGRVTSAFGLVCDGTSKVNSHPAPITYPAIHAMYNPKNGVNTGALLAHDGHIISSQLGGEWTNNDPLNFFPHHPSSNVENGVWWRMELIAREVRDILQPYSGCQVQIWTSLDYSLHGNPFVPSGGSYSIDVNDVCGDSLKSLSSLLGDYASAFVKGAVPVTDAFQYTNRKVGLQPLKGYRLTANWSNAPDFNVDQQLPPMPPTQPTMATQPNPQTPPPLPPQ